MRSDCTILRLYAVERMQWSTSEVTIIVSVSSGTTWALVREGKLERIVEANSKTMRSYLGPTFRVRVGWMVLRRWAAWVGPVHSVVCDNTCKSVCSHLRFSSIWTRCLVLHRSLTRPELSVYWYEPTSNSSHRAIAHAHQLPTQATP